MTSDQYAVVYPGRPGFPVGAVRAMNRGLKCADEKYCDSYVALWLTEEGEAVFGRAWNNNGSAEASFPWGGRQITHENTNGYRILQYIGLENEKGFKYEWKKACELDHTTLMYSGEYSPCVVQCGGPSGEECLGKAKWVTRQAWTVRNGEEQIHTGSEFEQAYLLVRTPV